MTRSTRVFFCALPAVLAALLAATAAGQQAPRKSCTFLFTYEAVVRDLKPGTAYRVWLPVPPSNPEQKVEPGERRADGAVRLTREAEYGNNILYVSGKAGPEGRATVSASYRVQRYEVRGELPAEGKVARFLQPDAHVPVGGKALQLIADKRLPSDPMGKAQVFYDTVFNHMRYSKEGTGWGRGDSDWACDSRYGNCSDFHSLFISLVRAQKIPAKFEIGFPLPPQPGRGEIGGYHCWAFFKPEGKGWIPVDISEARKDPKMHDYYFGNLTADRVTFSTGRDIMLEPKQDGPPLNFFVYPYVEVDGKPYPAEKVGRKFTFEDVGS
jgi:transglutaminase-like putative cysteine protease